MFEAQKKAIGNPTRLVLIDIGAHEKLANRLIFAVYQSSAASPNEIEQVELSLVSPSRYDSHSVSLMLRPPPANS
jgi:hypothetical protein